MRIEKAKVGGYIGLCCSANAEAQAQREVDPRIGLACRSSIIYCVMETKSKDMGGVSECKKDRNRVLVLNAPVG